MKRGIDISYANGNIDWDRLKKADHTDFVAIKCNTGVGCPDNQFTRNAILAYENKKPSIYYHWCTLNKPDVVEDARAEAKEFIYVLKWMPKAMLHALDIEEENKLNISPQNLELWIETYMHELRLASVTSVIYSFPGWLNSYLSRNHKLGKYPLWLSHVGVNNPMMPMGWKDWLMWQYSWKGKVDGISTDVDLNYMKIVV